MGCAALNPSYEGESVSGRQHIPLESGRSRCYISAMMASRGWMLRITGPILG